ncbi:MAG: hypothetical protein ACOCYE_13305 [Pseudomonadota bacterium]
MIVLGLLVAEAAAQDRGQLELEADRLLQAMRLDPRDLDLAFAYSEVAIALGDYEAAVGALERMLVLDPDLPRVRLELGALYFRLEAYEVARVYLDETLALPNVPPEVEARVRELIAAIDARTARHAWSANLFVGARYQTNANAGPSSRRIDLGGIDVVLDDEVTGQADVNAFALLNGTYGYDLGTQARDTLELAGLAFGALYAEERQLDLTVLEVDAGPRLQLAERGLPRGSIRPYVSGAMFGLDRAMYSTSIGGGLNLRLLPTERASVDLYYDLRQDDFVASSDQPTADERDATYQALRGVLRYALDERVVVEGTLLGADNHAEESFRSFTEIVAGASLLLGFDAPLLAEAPPWYVGIGGTLRRVDYDRPDPLLDPATTRRDDEWRVGASLTANVTGRAAVITRIDYRDVRSNVDLYDFDNTAVSVGFLWRF